MLSIIKVIQADAKSEGRSGELEFNKPQGRETISGLGRNAQQFIDWFMCIDCQ